MSCSPAAPSSGGRWWRSTAIPGREPRRLRSSWRRRHGLRGMGCRDRARRQPGGLAAEKPGSRSSGSPWSGGCPPPAGLRWSPRCSTGSASCSPRCRRTPGWETRGGCWPGRESASGAGGDGIVAGRGRASPAGRGLGLARPGSGPGCARRARPARACRRPWRRRGSHRARRSRLARSAWLTGWPSAPPACGVRLAGRRAAHVIPRCVARRSRSWSAVERGLVVIAASTEAAAEGVTSGLRRREAEARCPGLTVAEADPQVEARVRAGARGRDVHAPFRAGGARSYLVPGARAVAVFRWRHRHGCSMPRRRTHIGITGACRRRRRWVRRHARSDAADPGAAYVVPPGESPGFSPLAGRGARGSEPGRRRGAGRPARPARLAHAGAGSRRCPTAPCSVASGRPVRAHRLARGDDKATAPPAPPPPSSSRPPSWIHPPCTSRPPRSRPRRWPSSSWRASGRSVSCSQ